ncbi:Transient receptor putative cation channel sub V member 5 [Chytriomyces hyalinus]|nr:Transient receptor putative cation channel sub V member 5 [Chytriomyces hyalinus]
MKKEEICLWLIKNYGDMKCRKTCSARPKNEIATARASDVDDTKTVYALEGKKGLPSDTFAKLVEIEYNGCYEGETALHLACKNGMLSVVEALLDMGVEADPVVTGDALIWNKSGKYPPLYSGDTPLQFAATQPKNLNIVRLLLKHGANHLHQDPYGNNVLHVMAFYGHYNDIYKHIQNMKKKGFARLSSVRNKEGFTPIQLGVYYRRANMLDALKQPFGRGNILGLKNFGPLILVIIKIITSGLARWLAIYGVLAFGYSIAFYAQMKTFDYDAQIREGKIQPEVERDWNNVLGGFFWTVRFLWGMYDVENMRNHSEQINNSFILITLFVNVFISLLVDIWNKVSKNYNSEWLLQMAKMIIDTDHSLDENDRKAVERNFGFSIQGDLHESGSPMPASFSPISTIASISNSVGESQSEKLSAATETPPDPTTPRKSRKSTHIQIEDPLPAYNEPASRVKRHHPDLKIDTTARATNKVDPVMSPTGETVFFPGTSRRHHFQYLDFTGLTKKNEMKTKTVELVVGRTPSDEDETGNKEGVPTGKQQGTEEEKQDVTIALTDKYWSFSEVKSDLTKLLFPRQSDFWGDEFNVRNA